MAERSATTNRAWLRELAPYAGAYGITRIVAATSAAASAVLAFVVAGAAAVGLYGAVMTTALVIGSGAGGWVGQALLRYGTGGQSGWWRLLRRGRGALVLASGTAASAGIAATVAHFATEADASTMLWTALLGGMSAPAFALLAIEILRRQSLLQPWRAGSLDILRAVSVTLPPAVAAQASSGLAATNLAIASALGLIFACLAAMAAADGRGTFLAADESDSRMVLRFWEYGWPLALWMLFSGFYQFGDRVMLAWIDSAAAAGEYSLLYDVFNRGLVFPVVAVATATNPLVYERYERNEPAEARRLNRLGIIIQVVITTVVAVPAAVGAWLAVSRVDWLGWPEAAAALIVYVAGAAWAIASSVQRRQMGEAVTPPLLWRLIAFAALNIGANAALIPPLGVLGAAIATIVASIGYLISVSVLVFGLRDSP